LVLFAATALPASASAAVTVGADLNQSVTDCNQCAALTLTKSSGAPELGSPISGVLVSARVRTYGVAGPGEFRILHPTGTTDEYRNDGVLPVTPADNAVLGGLVTEVPARLPIQAGDRISVAFPNLDVFFIHSAPLALCAVHLESIPATEHGFGTNALYTTPPCGAHEVLVQGTVEADADHDGYGDETQDLCPTDPTTHGPCPSVATTGQRAAALAKCKKKHSHKKRKKCRKRANLLPV
jgi:hypothetical protein